MSEVDFRGQWKGLRQMATVALVAVCAWVCLVEGAIAAPPQILKTMVSEVTSTSASLEAEINPQGKATRYHFEYGTAACLSSPPCISIPLPEGELPAGSSPVPVKVTVENLAPGGIYHFRVTAKNGEGGVIKGPDRVFATRTAPSTGLPDGRAYEQSSPVDKDGGDALGKIGLVKAADDGDAISFNNSFGIPGGQGAQALPLYLATRGGGGSGWSTQGLLPPPIFGERARVQGWLPDFSETFTNAEKLGDPRSKALVSQSTDGGPAVIVSPYTPDASYFYAGANAGASVVFFESLAALPAEEGEGPIDAAIQGRPNLYAWDRASGRLSLAGIRNDGTAPPRGVFAGPYDWSKGISPQTLRGGGANRGYYLQATHAITSAGDVYFTESGTGQLFLRLNPTQPQSAIVADKCTEPAKACTIYVSASKRTPPDPAGLQPAAFQAASADGSEALFTSPEKLTDSANTGPEQPAAAIGVGSATSGAIEDADFIPKRAVGVAVDSGHIYWADPVTATIGRANIDGEEATVEEAFIEVGASECEESEPGVFEQVPSRPRYLAVDSGHLYWSNTGKAEENGDPAEKGGTIGRADLDGAPASVDPDFICGASNPQGIAVNATHIYWANAAQDPIKRSLARAKIDGEEAEQEFFADQATNLIPYGVALGPSYVYWGLDEPGADNASLGRIPLGGGSAVEIGIEKAGIRGLAADAGHVYWATQGEEAIGRVDLELKAESLESEFVKEIEGKLFGVAVDASRLYWSVNGESPSNPGNDLYRFEPATGALEDLTPLASGNGAEVLGVVGLSSNGAYLYFVANGDLDGAGGAASTGNCHGPVSATSGACNLYLRHEGVTTFVARLGGADSLNWTGTPIELSSTASNTPKTAFLSEDGRILLFRSTEKLTDYDNEGVAELYRYSAITGGIACVSCPPSGEAVGKGPGLGSIAFPGEIGPSLATVASFASRNLSLDGSRVFFETAEALVPGDTNGQVGCPGLGLQATPACLDVYEWEAPGAGGCKESGPAYSPLNGGCLYLISTGKSERPSYFADASASGGDVFFFTRQQLVGQDKDQLQDVYDARVGGGLVSQHPVTPTPCESGESCPGPVPTPPSESSPGTLQFVGPANAVQKHKKHKHKKQKGKKHKAKHKKAQAKRKAGR